MCELAGGSITAFTLTLGVALVPIHNHLSILPSTICWVVLCSFLLLLASLPFACLVVAPALIAVVSQGRWFPALLLAVFRPVFLFQVPHSSSVPAEVVPAGSSAVEVWFSLSADLSG